MGKYGKKTSSKRKVLTGAGAVLCVALVLMLVVLAGNKIHGKKPNEGTSQMKELLVESVTEQEDTILVDTTYATVRYPYMFSDIMNVEAETYQDCAELVFTAEIDGKVFELYTLTFNGEEGMPVGTLRIDGETYVVTAQFHEVRGVSDDTAVTVHAAQDTLNDVVNSLSENEGFTAVTE